MELKSDYITIQHLWQSDPKVKLKVPMEAVAAQWGDQISLAVFYLLASKQFSM
jgi:DUF1680 family protein